MAIDKSLMAGSTTMLILNLIESQDMYGYQMVKELENRSNQVFSLKEGTLYPILHNLEKEGMIEVYQAETEQGRQRKYYRITREGRKLLDDKKKEWKSFSKAVDHVIGGALYAW